MFGHKQREGAVSYTHLRAHETREEVGGGWVKQVMGIKDSICHDEHWVTVMYGIVESLYCRPETNKYCMLTNWN